MPQPRQLIPHHGKYATSTVWARILGVARSTILKRFRAGIPLDTPSPPPHVPDELWPGANSLPWSKDRQARLLLKVLGRPMTYDEIGACMGYSRGAIEHTERRAFRKIRRALGMAGKAEVLAWLKQLNDLRGEDDEMSLDFDDGSTT